VFVLTSTPTLTPTPIYMPILNSSLGVGVNTQCLCYPSLKLVFGVNLTPIATPGDFSHSWCFFWEFKRLFYWCQHQTPDQPAKLQECSRIKWGFPVSTPRSTLVLTPVLNLTWCFGLQVNTIYKHWVLCQHWC
jgi:hypothetical protein